MECGFFVVILLIIVVYFKESFSSKIAETQTLYDSINRRLLDLEKNIVNLIDKNIEKKLKNIHDNQKDATKDELQGEANYSKEIIPEPEHIIRKTPAAGKPKDTASVTIKVEQQPSEMVNKSKEDTAHKPEAIEKVEQKQEITEKAPAVASATPKIPVQIPVQVEKENKAVLTAKMEEPEKRQVPATEIPTLEIKKEEVKEYTEKAGRFEMQLAGNWFNIAGIALIMAGSIFFLKQAVGQNSSGIWQVIAGVVISAVLIILGEKFHRLDYKNFSYYIVGGGFCVLLFTISASYFYYHLYSSKLILAGLLFALVAISGASIFRYDSKIIANIVLFIAFVNPFIMSFKLGDLNILYCYLIAINLGVVVIAFSKKWDYYIAISFLMSYLHYFSNYSLTKTSPGATITFLTVFYLIFLISNNSVHLRHKISGDFNLFISYFNPLLYACISYYILLKAPNAYALLLYAALGAIHIFLALASRRMRVEEQDPYFADITRNNLILGLLFTTAAISFITYFTDTDKFFAVVTALWFAEAYILLWISFKASFSARIFREFSYIVLGIIWVQMISVVSWMPESNSWQMLHKFGIYFGSMIMFYVYFNHLYKNRGLLSKLDNAMMAVSLLSCFGTAFYLIYDKYPLDWICTIAAAFAWIILVMGFKMEDKLSWLRYAAYTITAIMGSVGIIHLANSSEPFGFSLPNKLFESSLPYIAFSLISLIGFHTVSKMRDKLAEHENAFLAMFAFFPVFIFHQLIISAFGDLNIIIPFRIVFAIIASWILIDAGFKNKEIMSLIKFFGYGCLLFAGIWVVYFISDLRYLQGETASTVLLLLSILYSMTFYFLYRRQEEPDTIDRMFLNLPAIAAIISLTSAILLYNNNIYPFRYYFDSVALSLLSLAVLFISFKFRRTFDWLRYPLSFITLIIVLSLLLMHEPMPTNYNYLIFMLAVPLICTVISFAILYHHRDIIFEKDKEYFYYLYLFCAAGLAMKLFLVALNTISATFFWSAAGLLLLYLARKKNIPEAKSIGLLAIYAAFIKSIVYDSTSLTTGLGSSTGWISELAHITYTKGSPQMEVAASSTALLSPEVFTLTWVGYNLLVLGFITLVYYFASRMAGENHVERDTLQGCSLVMIAFELSAILFSIFGILDNFQVILTIFWAAISLISIIIGLLAGRKIFRLAGLVLMTSAILKIIFVDMWVLKFYGMASWFLILGALLVITSFLYQKNREMLSD